MADQNMVYKAHQRLQYYAIDGAADSRPSPVPMPYNFPSNSVESRRLRQERAQEIEDILRSAEKQKSCKSAPLTRAEPQH